MVFSSLTMVTATSFDNTVQAFHVMRENDIGFDKFTTSYHGIIGMTLRFTTVNVSLSILTSLPLIM